MHHNPEHTWGHALAFGDEYYQKVTEILRQIRGDAEIYTGIATWAVEALRAGNKVYSEAAVGHMPPFEMADEREGNPAQIHLCGHNCTAEDFAALRPGDVLLTNHVSEPVRAARDAGVYVAYFTTAYVNSSKTPPGKVHANPNDWLPEDVASIVVDTHIPWNQGVVHMSHMPEMPAFPSATNGTCAIHWLLTAEVAHAMATDSMPDGSAACRYLDLLLERLAEVRAGDMERINETAEIISKRIIGGGRFFVRSRNEGVRSESNGTAMGLMLTNAFETRSAIESGDKDTFLIAAVSANDAQELAWAREARENGNYLIGIGPLDNDGLRQACDVYFDDRCDEPAGVVEIPGMAEKVCPATGIINNIIMHMLTAQFVDEMCRRGAVPYFWMGAYMKEGSAYNGVMGSFFRDRGY